MGKTKTFPLKDEKYTKVLVEICRDTPSIGELARRIGKKDASATEYLDELEKLGCIERKLSRKPFKHKKEVLINWQKLTEQYLIYLIKEQEIKLLKTEIEDYSKNIYIQKLIEIALAGHQKSVHNFRKIGTVYQLFEKITMQMIYGEETFSNSAFKKLKRKYQFIWFKRFIKDIKNQKMADKRKTFKKLLRRIIKEIEEDKISKKNN